MPSLEASAAAGRLGGLSVFASLTSTPVLLGAILGVSTLLRVLFLGTDSLWIDEALSVATARLDWASFLELVSTRNTNMVLYMILLRFWLLLGDSEFIIRSFSIIPAVATVPVLYRLGAVLFGRQVGLIAAVLLAANVFHIGHSQEARSYTLLVFLVTLSSLFFVRAMREPSRRNWLGYAAVSALAVYSHLFGALVPAAHWVSLMFLRPRSVPWKGLVASTLAIGVLVMPIGVFLLNRNVWGLGWYDRSPGPASVVRVFYVLTGGLLPLLVYLLACLLAIAATVRIWRSSWASPQAWRHGLIYSWLLVPIVLAFGVSFVSPSFLSRYLIVSLPPLVLLAACGLAAIRRARLLAAALVVFTILAGYSVASHYARPSIENWRDATHYLLARAGSGDAVMFHSTRMRPAFEYYRDRLRGSPWGPTVVFPLDPRGTGIWESGTERMPASTLVEEIAARHNRVWLVLSHDQVTAGRSAVSLSLQEFLASRYPAVNEKQFAGVKIVLFSRDR